MARTREFDPEQALERAVRLFWDRGFTDTSMEDLVRETGVSRYGFYGTFGSKRKFFEVALERYTEEMARTVMAGLLRPDAGLKEIRQYFENIIALGMSDEGKRGCLLCNTAIEVGAHDKRIARVLRGYFARMSGIFENALGNAVKAGDLRLSKKEIPARARYMTGAVQGMAVLARAGFDEKALREFVDTLLATLD